MQVPPSTYSLEDWYIKREFTFCRSWQYKLTNKGGVIIIAGKPTTRLGCKIASKIQKLQANHQNIFSHFEHVEGELRSNILAGSDFIIIPSIFELFGFTDIEAAEVGTIPIVNNPELRLWKELFQKPNAKNY